MNRLKFLMKNLGGKWIGTEKRQRIRATKPVSSFVIGQRFLKFLTSYLHTFIPSVFSLTLSLLLPTFAFLLFTFNFAHAGGYCYWTPDGVRLSDTRAAPSDIVSDGKGGAIVILDGSAITDSIYAQRVDGNGNLLWGSTGAVVTGAGYIGSTAEKAVSDDKGGIIVVFERWRGASDIDLLVQHLDSTGAMLWSPGGVLICDADSEQRYPAIVSDGAGGAIIAWQDGRNGTSGKWDIYAQRVDSAGNVRWTLNGVAVCTAIGQQERPSICSDGEKGVVVTWFDTRNDVYAQRIDSNGVVKWGQNGTVICSSSNTEGGPALDLVDTNSIIIAWMDNRNSNFDIYAQRINLNADTLWSGGVAICTAESIQGGEQVIQDAYGGAIILWYDERSNGLYDFYIQRVDSNGVIKWTSDGVPVCTDDSVQVYPAMVSDGAGGAIIAWEDRRNYSANRLDIYAQHIDSSGNVLWDTNGMAICTAPWGQGGARITTDMVGGAIIAWGDGRDLAGKTYAQRVNDEPPLLLSDIWLSDTLHNFGDVILGDSAFWLDLVIKNFGLDDLIIDSVILTDSVFSVVSGSFPDTIPPWGNDSMMVMVKFIPVDTGYVSGFLTVYSNDPDEESLSIRLMGNGILGIEEDRNLDLQNVVLFSVFPNPFKKNTTIKYNLPTQAEMKLKIYDISGRIVKTLVNESKDAGAYKVFWNGTDSKGRLLPSGVYFSELYVINQRLIKKIILLR